jgi:hypothetical protein
MEAFLPNADTASDGIKCGLARPKGADTEIILGDTVYSRTAKAR